MTADLSGKRLELLKEVLPRLSRVAVLGNSANAGNGTQLREVERAADAFKMQLQYLDILSAKDIDPRSAGLASSGLTQFLYWRVLGLLLSEHCWPNMPRRASSQRYTRKPTMWRRAGL